MSILCGSIPEKNTEIEEFRVLHEMFSGKLTDIFIFGKSSPLCLGWKFFHRIFRIWFVCFTPFLCKKSLCQTSYQFLTLPVVDSSCCMVGFGCITHTLMLHPGLLSKWSLQSCPGPGDEVACCQDMLMVYAGSHKEPETGMRRETM